MARPPRFSDDDVLDAALAVVGRGGAAGSIADVATELSGPVGSIYHRFASRDELFIRLWLRSVRRFQQGLLHAVDLPDPHQALLAGAEFCIEYCHQHPDEASALRLHHQQRLLGGELPEELRNDVEHLNDVMLAALADLARRRYPRSAHNDLVSESGSDPATDNDAVQRVHLAVRIVPYGTIRPWLGGGIPEMVRRSALIAAEAVLLAGDTDTG